MNVITIDAMCILCKGAQPITMSKDAYDKWQGGMYLQDAAPELTADEREMLISGICGKCFDDLFEEGNGEWK